MENIWCISRFHAKKWPISRFSIIYFHVDAAKIDHQNIGSTSRFRDWKWRFSQIHVLKSGISRSRHGLQFTISRQFSADFTFSRIKFSIARITKNLFSPAMLLDLTDDIGSGNDLVPSGQMVRPRSMSSVASPGHNELTLTIEVMIQFVDVCMHMHTVMIDTRCLQKQNKTWPAKVRFGCEYFE